MGQGKIIVAAGIALSALLWLVVGSTAGGVAFALTVCVALALALTGPRRGNRAFAVRLAMVLLGALVVLAVLYVYFLSRDTWVY